MFKLSNEEMILKYTNGELQYKEFLIKKNWRLVTHFANKYQGVYNEIDDLESVGLIALNRAIDSYDINREISFSSFASICICNEMIGYIRQNRKRSEMSSLNESIVDTENFEIIDMIHDNEAIVEENIMNECDIEDLYASFSFLNDEEMKLIIMYYYDNMNQEQIANQILVSQTYVSRTLKKAIDKLRIQMKNINNNNMIWYYLTLKYDIDLIKYCAMHLEYQYYEILIKYHGIDFDKFVHLDILEIDEKVLLLKAYKLLSNSINKIKSKELELHL